MQTSKLKVKYEEEAAIQLLASRLKYYPLIQLLSRSAYTWYELQFGFTFNPATETANQYAAQCLVALITPSGAVGYFIVFLCMQPYAWKYLYSRVTTGRKFQRPAKALTPAAAFSKRDSDLYNADDKDLIDILRYDSFGAMLSEVEQSTVSFWSKSGSKFSIASNFNLANATSSGAVSAEISLCEMPGRFSENVQDCSRYTEESQSSSTFCENPILDASSQNP